MVLHQPTVRWRHTVSGSIREQKPPSTMAASPWEKVEWSDAEGDWIALRETRAIPEDERLANVPIKGYRQLSALELELTNKVKEHAQKTGELVEFLENARRDLDVPFGFDIDLRWIAIAKTDLQKGYMALVRAITRPEIF